MNMSSKVFQDDAPDAVEAVTMADILRLVAAGAIVGFILGLLAGDLITYLHAAR